MKRYHFSLGNSSDGPVGFCAAVYADTEEQAVKLLQGSLPEEQAVDPLDSDEPGEVEYISAYLNPEHVTAKDIDEVYEVCPRCPDHAQAEEKAGGGWSCPFCRHEWTAPAEERRCECGHFAEEHTKEGGCAGCDAHGEEESVIMHEYKEPRAGGGGAA